MLADQAAPQASFVPKLAFAAYFKIGDFELWWSVSGSNR
jgi:hypothetical protein